MRSFALGWPPGTRRELGCYLTHPTVTLYNSTTLRLLYRSVVAQLVIKNRPFREIQNLDIRLRLAPPMLTMLSTTPGDLLVSLGRPGERVTRIRKSQYPGLPLAFALPPDVLLLVLTPGQHRRGLRVGDLFAWCTLAALAGCPTSDPVSRAPLLLARHWRARLHIYLTLPNSGRQASRSFGSDRLWCAVSWSWRYRCGWMWRARRLSARCGKIPRSALAFWCTSETCLH